jgi:membrane protein
MTTRIQASEEAKEAKPGVLDRLRGRVRSARAKWPVLDHAVRALDRNSQILGSQEAAAVTYFGFLAFFPLLALSFSLVGYVSAIYPQVQDAVTTAVEDAFPNLIGPNPDQISIRDVIGAKRTAGLLGLAGLVYAGLGWIDALRNAVRRTFGTDDVRLQFIKKKLIDIGVLILLGISLLASVIVTSAATAATTFVLDLVELDGSLPATVMLKVLSVAMALAADTVLFAILLSRLSGASLPWRQVRSGAFVGACGFELLKLVGTFLIGRTTDNPIYAAFGVVVGLLVWMNLVAKITVLAAAWTVTQPFSLHPGDLAQEGAGQSTPLAAATEPVTVVAPPDYEQVPVMAGRASPGGSARTSRPWRTFALGAVTGAAGVAMLTSKTQRRRGE